jgi:hypothetical protein
MEEELKKEIESLKNRVNLLTNKVGQVEQLTKLHKHTGYDESSRIDGDVTLLPNRFLTIGNAQITEDTRSYGSAAQVERLLLITGKDMNSGFTNTSENTQLQIENQSATTGSSNQSFFYGLRAPVYTDTATDDGSSNTVTSAAFVVNDTTKTWTTNELAGAMVNIYSSAGALVHSKQIASNTSTQITVDDAWDSTVSSGGSYIVWMPVYMGSADYPWRRGYFMGSDSSSGGDGTVMKAIQLGRGPSGGTDVIAIFYGAGTPESAVTANIGSLFLRTDGGTSTTLYVKESGTSNTGWVAK